MTYRPDIPTEPRYNLNESARRLRMPVNALIRRLDAGDIESEFNGRGNFISASEITRFSAERRREAQAEAEAEQEQQKAQEDEVVRDEIARDMKHLNERAKKIGMGFLAED